MTCTMYSVNAVSMFTANHVSAAWSTLHKLPEGELTSLKYRESTRLLREGYL